jgi:hypothetical protein
MTFEDKFDSSVLDSNSWNPWMGEAQYGRWGDSGALPSPYGAMNNCPGDSCASANSLDYSDPYPSGYATNTSGDHLITGSGLRCIATTSGHFSSIGYSWATCTISSYDKVTLPATGTTYIQFHAKMPDSRYGAWAGLWFLNGGSEIDLQESGTCSGCQGSATANQILAMHNWNDGTHILYNTGVDLTAAYHTYALEYCPGSSIKMYFDGTLQLTSTTSVPTGAYTVIIGNDIANPSVASGWHTVADPTNHPGPFELDIDDIQIYHH